MTNEMLKRIEDDIAAMNIQSLPPAGAVIETVADGKRGKVLGYVGSCCMIQVEFENGHIGDVPYGMVPQAWRFAW